MAGTLLAKSEIRLNWSDIHSRMVKTKKAKTSVRSSGIHLSGIIKHVMDMTADDTGDEMPLRMAVGMAWEDWAVGLWPDLIWQPGEKQCDGIFGSPDGVTKKSDTCPGQVEEFKATWKSRHNRGDILRENLWMWQIAGYCKMLKVTHARMHILWVNGDYRPPNPEYYIYTVQFTQQEIDSIWTKVFLGNKDGAVPEVWK